MVTAATSPLIDNMAEIGKIIVWHVLVQFLYPETNKLLLKARGEKFASGFKIIRVSTFNFINHKNYNFLACDWFKKGLFSTNSLAKLLSDSLLLDSLLLDSLLSDSSKSQSHSKM